MKDSEILAEQELRDIYYDPFAGYRCGKVIPEGKGAKPGREESGEGLVEDPGHVHEIQTDH